MFSADIIKGARDLKVLKQIGNKFVLPEVVNYNDYINTGFDAMMAKQKAAKNKQKADKKSANKKDSKENSHMSVEITLKSLYQMVRKVTMKTDD